MNAGRTSIVITHDTELLRRIAPRIILLHEGRVQHDGDYESLSNSKSPVIRRYVEMMPVLQKRLMPQVA